MKTLPSMALSLSAPSRSTSTMTYGPSHGGESLCEAEDQVSDVEGLTPYSMTVVLAQRLLVLDRAKEGNIACFI